MEVLVEREGVACSKRSDSGERCEVKIAHIKGVGSQRELPTINWPGWVLNGSFGREGGRGEEATYERGWE